MEPDPPELHRQSHRLPGHDYSSAAAYFVTIVTSARTCLFGHVIGDEMVLSPLGRLADEYFRAIPSHFPNADIDACQVVPNHVHGIIVISDPLGTPDVGATHWVAPTRTVPSNQPKGPRRGSIGAMLGAYKMAVARQATARFGLSAVWQRNDYDHIIRNDREWRAIRDYILSNPMHWIQDGEHPEKW